MLFNSVSEKQAATGRRRRIVDDFRHQLGLRGEQSQFPRRDPRDMRYEFVLSMMTY